MSEHVENDPQSGKEIEAMLCNMSHEKLLEVVQNCPASMFQQFMPNVTVPIAPAVVSIPASSSGQRVQTLGREPGQEGMQFFKVSVLGSPCWPWVSKDSQFLCTPPTATAGVVAGAGSMHAGAPVVSAPGTVPVSFFT